MARDKGASSFDELAIGLASGKLSRGKAIRLMGAALVGGVLASVPGVAWAAKPLGYKGCPIAGTCRVNGECECRRGVVVTPVGGGDPFCSCNFECHDGPCEDCPEGYVCVNFTEGLCPGLTNCARGVCSRDVACGR
jgi:hypothetical protein